MSLQIEIKEAHELRRTNLIGSNDVYVLVKQGIFNSAKTQTVKGAGRDATFNETLQIDYKEGEELMIECYDSDIGRDDLIGCAAVSADSISSGHWSGDVVLMNDNDAAGTVSLTVRQA